MMQNAALLWHVSLLVPPERKGLALGMVGLVRVVPIVVFSMISGVVADAWDRRRLMLFTQIAATLVAAALARAGVPRPDARSGRSMSLAALGVGGRRVRSAGAQRAGADAGAARAPAERDQPEHDHVPDRVGRRPVARRHADRRRRRRLGVRRQCDLVRLRDRRAADDARRAGAPAVGGRARATTCRCTRRSKGCGSSSARRSSDRRCCSISSRRSFRRRPRCCRSSRRTSCSVGAKGYGWLYAAPAVGALADQRGDGADGGSDRAARRRRCCGRWPATGWPRSSSVCRDRSG